MSLVSEMEGDEFNDITCVFRCHVMERESFEDEETARVLNADFIAIKVDREERPDVDRVYMSYVQATRGQGGWPMSVFLTPDLKPFFGGTYFPKEERYGMPSFKGLLNAVASSWKEKQHLILEQSEETMEELKKYLVNKETFTSTSDDHKVIGAFISGCAESLTTSFDRVHGGFGNAPKFPRPSEMHALIAHSLRCKDRAKAEEVLQMVRWTLQKMSEGGIYDHIGGGFHRYSVDEIWHVPHFEKMLYDNPQIAILYLRMYQMTKEPKWANVACGILDYLNREMRDPLGGIYSAEDADSFDESKGEKTEGAFYVWTSSELEKILDQKEFEVFCAFYNVRRMGNCMMSEMSDPHQEFIAKNCLYISKDKNEIASSLGMDTDEMNSVLIQCRKKIYTQRRLRPKPHLDNKIVTAWNGMAISAFAKASRILKPFSSVECFPVDGRPADSYLQDAKKIAQFIVEYLWDESAQILRRSYCGGISNVHGFADDYAWTIAGFLDLYEHSGDYKWLQWAVRLQDRMDEIFFDSEAGGYFSTAGDDPTILLRLKEEYDSAEPAASSIALSNLVRLSAILSSKSASLMEKAKQTLQSFASRIGSMPVAMPQLAFSMYLYENLPTGKKVVICGSMNDDRTEGLLDAVHADYNPSKALIAIDLNDADALSFWKRNSLDNIRVLGKVVDWKEDDQSPTVLTVDMSPTAYVCANFTCKAPTQNPETLIRQLRGKESTLVELDMDILQRKL